MRCLILDIDATLIKSFKEDYYTSLDIENDINLRDIKARTYKLPFDNLKWGIKRPYFDEFSDFIFENFDIVAVWSAGGYDYVHAVLDQIFGEKKEGMHVYTHDDCEKNSFGNLTKPISQMIENKLGLKHLCDMTNTIIIDDLNTTFSKNPNNAINIPEFDPDGTIESLRQRDVALLQIMNWVRTNKTNKEDVRTISKDYIFDYIPRKCNSLTDITNSICELEDVYS